MSTVRIALPVHLQDLARVDGEVLVRVSDEPTVDSVLDALEAEFPALRGTIRDHGTRRRRAFIRYYACGEDISHDPPENPLPTAVADGSDAFCVIGAISGG
jgi:sulfur-carrier protein